MADEREDLSKFLKDVDEVETIIKNLSSQDEGTQKEAMKSSERLLKKKGDQDDGCTKFNRTVVNTVHKENKLDHQEQILKGIESDANERAERRKKNEAEAEKLKVKGNLAFKAERYNEAIVCYTEAINFVKYVTSFYTNRAQAYIKIGNYNAAIDDCKWAMRIDEKCVKAYVHCGRALQRKACFSEAITYFRNAEQIDPKQERIIKGYIAQVENEEQKNDLERKAVAERDSGDKELKSVNEIVKTLMESKTKLEECISSVKSLQKLLENNKDCKTMFRVISGFDCFNKYTEFKRLCDMSDKWKLPEHENFVHEMLILAMVAVAEDEYNIEALLDHGIIDTIHNLHKTCTVDTMRSASVTLLLQITEFPSGRKTILEHANNDRYFIDGLLQFITARNSVSKLVLGCMNNLALEQRFSLQYSAQLEKIVIPIVVMFADHHHQSSLSQSTKIPSQLLLIASCFSTLANLARNKDARCRLQLNQQIWQASVKILTMYIDDVKEEDVREMVYAELGLLINVLSEVSDNAKSYASSIYPLLRKLLASQDSLLQRTFGVLRLLLGYSSETLELVCNDGTYKLLLQLVKLTSDVATVSYGVKCLALCTLRNATAKKYVSDNELMTFYKLLKSESEVTIGNSALILGSCFEQKEACEKLVGTPIVKDMLTIATNEELSKDVKNNTAIALAKLVKNDQRFLEQLRELHGLEILHSVIK